MEHYKIFIGLIMSIILGISILNWISDPKLTEKSNDSLGNEGVKLFNGTKIDSLVVNKAKREMIVFSNGKILKKYRISLGKNPIGHKNFEGDKKTPEGAYIINDKNPNSTYHRNLGISYPNEQDIDYAKRFGKSPGGDIKIHGLRNGTGFMGKLHRYTDWTLGCIAVTNDEIEELFETVEIGTPIQINP